MVRLNLCCIRVIMFSVISMLCILVISVVIVKWCLKWIYRYRLMLMIMKIVVIELLFFILFFIVEVMKLWLVIIMLGCLVLSVVSMLLVILLVVVELLVLLVVLVVFFLVCRWIDICCELFRFCISGFLKLCFCSVVCIWFMLVGCG